MIDVKIRIENIDDQEYPAVKDKGCHYIYNIDSIPTKWGAGGPAVDKEEIVNDLKNIIVSEENHYGDKINIKEFVNETNLELTTADIKGESKLTNWFG